MKIKRLCGLAVLLTSSLAGAASNSASNANSHYRANRWTRMEEKP